MELRAMANPPRAMCEPSGILWTTSVMVLTLSGMGENPNILYQTSGDEGGGISTWSRRKALPRSGKRFGKDRTQPVLETAAPMGAESSPTPLEAPRPAVAGFCIAGRDAGSRPTP